MDMELLKLYARERGYNPRRLAKETKIPQSSFYYHLRNNNFNSKQLQIIFTVLQLTDNEIVDLFK